jgi:hypothetical protein
VSFTFQSKTVSSNESAQSNIIFSHHYRLPPLHLPKVCMIIVQQAARLHDIKKAPDKFYKPNTVHQTSNPTINIILYCVLTLNECNSFRLCCSPCSLIYFSSCMESQQTLCNHQKTVTPEPYVKH